MNYSSNYNLKKPERNEQFNLDDWNNNTDAIDTAMNTNKTNIANNASNISTILTGLSTVNTSDTNSVYYKLMKLIYPVGSLYWSSKSTNPGTLFGGTWTQIKDKFVLACGDTYNTTGATGGNSSIKLSQRHLPNHTHRFTPIGHVTGGKYIFTGTSVNSSGASTDTITIDDPGHTHIYGAGTGTDTSSGSKTNKVVNYDNNKVTGKSYTGITATHPHTHKVTAKGTISVFTNPQFTGDSSSTQSTGNGTAFSILPPYVVKYCWERTN